MIIYKQSGEVWRDVDVLDSSYQEESIQGGERKIRLEFVLAESVDVPQLSYVEWLGARYTLYSTSHVTKASTREYRYAVTFEGEEAKLKDILCKFIMSGNKTKFVMTATPQQFADMLALNVHGWTAGECIEAEPKTVSFSEDSVLSASERIAKEFETEVDFTGNKFAFRKRQLFVDDPLVLSYRNGLQANVSVSPDGDETPIGKLYVQGGERNIDREKYGSSTLHLPKGASMVYGGHTYKTDEAGQYIYIDGDTRQHTAERSFDATQVYPSREGVVSSVELKPKTDKEGKQYNDYDIIDTKNTVDYGQYRVGGEVMTIIFQTGRLAGKSFAIATKDDALVGYNHTEKRFMLVRQEHDGIMMPEPTTYYPEAGDKYAVFGCSLPQEYIDQAEQEMFRRGVEYMCERLEYRRLFAGDLDGIWAKRNWSSVGHKLVLGATVRLTDPELGATQDVRISGIRRDINSRYTPRLTFSNAPFIVGTASSRIASLEAREVRVEEAERLINKLSQRTYNSAIDMRALIDALELKQFTESISPRTISTIQGIFGLPECQFIFVKGMTDTTEVPFVYSLRNGGTELFIPAQYVAKEKQSDTLTSSKQYDVYLIQELTYSLKDDETSLYLYAQLSSGGNKFILTKEPLPLTAENNLVGLVTGLGESRQLTTLYGVTEITPGQVMTKMIRSASGNVYWDLVTGDLVIGDPKGDTCLAWIGGKLYIKGLLITVGGEDKTIEQALAEQDKKVEDIDKHQPIIQNGTWWRWDGAQYVDTGEVAKGQDAQGVRPNEFYMSAINVNVGCQKDDANKTVIINVDKDGYIDAYFSAVGKQANASYLLASKRVYSWTVTNNTNGDVLVGNHLYNSRVDGNPTSTPIKPNESVRYYTYREDIYRYIICSATRLASTTTGQVVISDIKGELVGDGESKLPTAYIAHSNDLKGADGKDGVSIIKVDIEFAVNTTPATAPTAGWATTAPTNLTDAQQLWTRTTTTYSAGTPTSSAPANITPKKGDAGATGTGLASITEEYAISDSKTVQPTTGWYATAPAWEQGKYIWSRVKVVLKDPQSTYYTGYSCSSEWEAVNAIQIGGRNLNAYSLLNPRVYLNNANNYIATTVAGHSCSKFLPCEPNTPYTISSPTPFSYFRFVFYDANQALIQGNFIASAKLQTYISPANAVYFMYSLRDVDKTIKIERGNKATDWSEAPEDVEARLQAGINEAKQATTDLKTYTDGAFADGIISKAEAISIEKLKNGVNEAWSRAFGEYSKVFANPALTGTPKTTLENTKISLAGAKDALLSAITTAIADGKSTPAEKSAVDTAYADFNTKLQAFQSALKDAEKAINDAVATSIATSKVDAEKQAREAEEKKLRDANNLALNQAKLAYERALGAGRFHGNYGEYSPTTKYPYNDAETSVVTYNGIPYRLIAEHTAGVAPGTPEGEKVWQGLHNINALFARHILADFAQIGDMKLYNGVGSDDYIAFEKKEADGNIHRYMQIGGTAKSEGEMVDESTTAYIPYAVSDRSSDSSGAFLVDNYISKEGNRPVKYEAYLGVYAEAVTRLPERTEVDYDANSYNGIPVYGARTNVSATLRLVVKSPSGAVKYEVKSISVSAEAITEDFTWFPYDNTRPSAPLVNEASDDTKIRLEIPPQYVAQGDTVQLYMDVSGTGETYNARASQVMNYMPEDKSKSLVQITKDKVSYFFGRTKYILFNYFSDIVVKIVGNALIQGNLTVSGTVKADSIDTSGAVLAGGEVDDYGRVGSPFGKYYNKYGTANTQVEKLGSGQACYLRVWHSINSTAYVPFVTPNKVPWSDQPSIVNKQANYFDVRFYNSSGQSYHYPFNYVCYRAG